MRPGNPRFQIVRTSPETIHWRLLGGNNVSLGAAAKDYAHSVECLDAIGWLGGHLDELTAEFAHASGGNWRWRLRSGDSVVAVATHAYGRRIEAQRGLDRFRSAAANAPAHEVETIADWRMKYRERALGDQ